MTSFFAAFFFAGDESTEPSQREAVRARFNQSFHRLYADTDRFFARLLLLQWLVCILLAGFLSPLTWQGSQASIHPHVYAAILLGGLVTGYPAWLGWKNAGAPMTRYVMAVAQMLTSALLIHVTGGRIETHFHVFGSLAFLAFYRNVRVLLTATLVVALDHFLRGFFWPQSVYGVLTASPWRTAEHAFWVLFEVSFLIASIRRSQAEMWQVDRRAVELEEVNGAMEQKVLRRTDELRASEERFRLLFEEAPVGLYRALPSGEILMANGALLALVGFETMEELSAAKIWMAGGERTDLFRQLQSRRKVFRHDATWTRRDGSTVYVQETIKPLLDASGNFFSFEGSVEDVTDQRQLEERYLQAQKVQAIGQLAGGVAHDFNNILTAIIGYSDLLLDRGNLALMAHTQVQEIKKASERAAGLTQQLLAFSRKQTLQPRVLRLNKVVSEMDQMLRRLLGEHIQVQTKLGTELAAVKVDPGQVQQVLMNLVVNARDAMSAGGRLTIETANATLDEEYCRLHPEAVPGSYVVIAVSDNGIGMSPDVQARVFEPFFTTKAVGTGTGLGLATCHGIVKQSGGHIGVYSELGIGTTFRVYFPSTTETVVEHETAEKSGGMETGCETIMLVEDEPMVRELGVLALSSLGYRVIEAANGVEAIQRLQKLGPNFVRLLVTDVVMPEMGGRELARQARELFPNLQILFSSGYTYDAIESSDLLEEGIFFLPKPYTMSVLAAKVREVLDYAPSYAAVA